MNARQRPTVYPSEIRAGGRASPTVYVRRPDHYAVLRRRQGDPADDAVLTLDGGSIAVFRGQADAQSSATAGDASRRAAAGAGEGPVVGPVYALAPNGPLAVPTGLIFARFADGVAADSRRDDLRRLGYDVVEVPSYAPNAAWLRAQSGEIADALAGAPALEALPDVEAVEPQMLMESARR
jgi:hypothetical protein